MDFFSTHWFAFTLLILGLALAALSIARPPRLSLAWLLPGATCILLAAGDLNVWVNEWALVIVISAAGVFFLLFLLVVLTGHWWAWLAYGVAAIFVFGLGSWAMPAATVWLADAGLFVTSLDVEEPWWLLGLLVVPVLVAVSYRRLASLGPVRRWVALGLRCLLVSVLVFALAETHARQPERDVTVIFVWDRSLSIPTEFEGDVDVRKARVFEFINNAVAKRGPGRDGDYAGVIVFGRWPRLELPPGKVRQLNFKKIRSPIDDNYTDIGAALKLALASFPEGAGKRIVLISDGNENLGNAEEQARLAQHNGIEIDVVAVASGRRSPNEVLVERIEAPNQIAKDSRLPLRVVLRSYHPDVVVGDLHLSKRGLQLQRVDDEKQEMPVFQPLPVLTSRVKLKQGLNVFFFEQPGLRQDEAFSYQAKFVPVRVETAAGKKLFDGLPGDRIQNNEASTMVVARGQRMVLLLEANPGEHQLLVDRLQQSSAKDDRPLKVVSFDPRRLPPDPDQLALILSKFDCIILANIPADYLSEAQQRVIRSNTHEQGAGLVMIGGNQSFGAGGWQETEVEKALPVTCDFKTAKVEAKAGLVLIMHASEMADGNAWQRKIAKLAIERLSPADMVGMIYYAGNWLPNDPTGHVWHIDFQQIRGNKGQILRKVDTLEPGDMPDVDPALTKAHNALKNPIHKLGTKHIIFISDGDHWNADPKLLKAIGLDGISLTTVCVTTHGNDAFAKMKKMALDVVAGGKPGRFYAVKDPSELPAIYMKETRLISQSFVHENQFKPKLLMRTGPTEGLAPPPDLFGFVRTSARKSPLVVVPIETPKIGEAEFPLLAYWQYGLGKSVAFTSDARTHPKGKAYWDRDWANSDMYNQFWKQAIEWSLRANDSGQFLYMTTEQKDGKVRVTVEALDKKKSPILNAELQAGLTSPTFRDKEARKVELKFEQKAAGIYEAEFQAEEVGSYFLHVTGKLPMRDEKGNPVILNESVRAGITIPYSPEFNDMESNFDLLTRLAEMTHGKMYDEAEENLERTAASGEIFRPVERTQPRPQTLWYFLVVLAGALLFFDVAVRRISIEPHEVRSKLQMVWASLRGRQTAAATVDPFMERLKSRKSQVDETLAKEKSSRRFDGGDGPPPPPEALGGEAPRGPAPKPPTPSIAPQKEQEATDYASRLMRAKKRAQEDRDKK